jgi:hypothetical protein
MKLIIILAAIIFIACTKQEMPEGRSSGYYQMVIEKHPLDTSRLYSRYLWELGILNLNESIKVDTAREMWYINCATMDTLEHLYYQKNGKKIGSK